MNSAYDSEEKSKAPRILLADDDPDDIYLIQSAFGKTDTRVLFDVVSDGQALLSRLASCLARGGDAMPDLIMLDLNMPVLDGKAVLRRLKQHADFRHIPVLVYTTSSSDVDVAESYALGASSHIVKLGTFDEMVVSMQRLIDYWFKTVRLSTWQLAQCESSSRFG